MQNRSNLPSPQTRAKGKKIPVEDRLLYESCPAHAGNADPNDYAGGCIVCTCGIPLSLGQQPLTSLYGSEQITVYVPERMLRGLGIDPCYDIQEQLNEHFECGDTIYVQPGFDYDFKVRIAFAKSYADHVFPCELALRKHELRGEIETKVGEILTALQLTANYSQIGVAA